MYIASVVILAKHLGLWDVSHAKDSIIWLVVIGFGLVLNSDRASKHDGFFRRTITGAIGLTALLEFYMNVLVFPLPVELVLQPVLVLLGLLSVVAGLNAKYRPAKSLVDGILAISGILIAVLVGSQLVHDWPSIDKPGLLLDLALPVWLTITSLPFVYAFGMILNYEVAFMRIAFATNDRRARRRAYLAIVLGLHLRIRALRSFAAPWSRRLAEAHTLREALGVVREYRIWLRSQQPVA